MGKIAHPAYNRHPHPYRNLRKHCPGRVNTKSRSILLSTMISTSPWCVGAHWFCYTDQPLTGRGDDGENYAIGFVDATDDAYPEMVEAAKIFHQESYQLRSKQRSKVATSQIHRENE